MKFRYLRGRLQQLGIDQTMLGRHFGVSQATISHRFSGRSPWTLPEMYELMDICGADPSELGQYFPRDGIDPELGHQIRVIKGGAG